jgi:predicted permease
MLFDLRLALRQLARSPGFSAIAILTLALGIGANTGAFGVLNALLLHVPPYPEPEALVRVLRTSPRGESGAHSPANFLDFRARNEVFTQVAASRVSDFNLGETGQTADRIRGLSVTADFFPLLRMGPQLGRVFTADEDRPGAASVIVLGHGVWQRRFAGDPGIVGRSIRVDGAPATVVGVMPAAFDDHQLWGRVDAWRPAAFPEATADDRDNTFLRVMARLKPGITSEQAQAGLNALCAQLAVAYPETNTDLGVRLVSLARGAQDETGRRVTWLVTGLAGFVLLIGCANLANLQFARHASRLREHAIRAALGASRAQRMRIVLLESVLLSLAGGVAGLVLALWTNSVVARAFTFGEVVGLEIPLDHRVLGFTLIVSVVTGIGFGLLPASLAARARVGDALKQGARGSTSGAQQGIRQALIVAEVALALTLLAGAGFFVRGLQRVLQRDAGWLTDEVVTASLSLRGQDYATSAARGPFYRRLHERLKALPGVEHVAISTSTPTAGYDTGNSFVVEGQPAPRPRAVHWRTWRRSRRDISRPLDPPPRRPRFHRRRSRRDDDRGRNQRNHGSNLLAGESAVGKRIGGATPYMGNPRVIIGVVSDVRAVRHARRSRRPVSVLSLAGAVVLQLGDNRAARPSRARGRRAGSSSRALRSGHDQAVYRVNTVRQEIDFRLRSIDVAGRTLVGFALVGLLLAALGIYGVIAHSVVQRTAEIGVRMALGAQVRDILALILGGGLRVIALRRDAGSRRGFRDTPPVGRALAGVCSGRSASRGCDHGLLVAVAMFACWLPARRAAKVDPMTALRAE